MKHFFLIKTKILELVCLSENGNSSHKSSSFYLILAIVKTNQVKPLINFIAVCSRICSKTSLV